MTGTGNLAKDSDEWKTVERMCEIITTFATTGNPNNQLVAPIEWEPVTFGSSGQTECSYKCLNVSNELSFIDWPEYERMQFWDEIYQQLSSSIKNENHKMGNGAAE